MIQKVANSLNRKGQKTEILAMNFGEFCDLVENYKGGRGCGSADKKREASFHGDKEFGENFESAKKLLWKGYMPDAMKSAFSGFETEFEAKTSMVGMDIEGHDFDVAAILSGDEEQWFKHKPVGGAPSVHIIFNGNAHCGIPAMNFYIQSAVINKLAELLELECQIKVSASYQMQGALSSPKKNIRARDLSLFVSVKDYDEPSNAKRLGGVSHPSFFRRNVFAVMENPDGKLYGDADTTNAWGYGYNGEDLVSEDEMNSMFGSDYTFRIPSPESHHFGDVESAVKYCKSVLAEIKSKIGVAA